MPIINRTVSNETGQLFIFPDDYQKRYANTQRWYENKFPEKETRSQIHTIWKNVKQNGIHMKEKARSSECSHVARERLF